MPNWYDITRDPEYQSLPEVDRLDLKKTFFNETIGQDPEFAALDDTTKQATWMEFMQSPDDTGEGIVRSTLGSAARGFGEIVPGTLQGVGALTGITPISDLGESARAGLEYVAPVNPIYEQGIPAKVANVAGNVASIIGTSGVGGLAGKALGAERAAAAGSAAARQALTNQAIQAGAKSALYGTGFAQGAAAKAEENKRLGITGAEGYLNLLGGGVSELAPEMLPFGTALESAAARRLLGGVDDAAGRVIPGIRMSAAQEAAEGGSTQVLSNLSTQLTAPTGVEAPDLFEGAGEAALWEGVGGAMFGAINKLGRTPPEKQTDEQKAYAAELGAVPVDSTPPITPEESLENFNQGGIPVVSPDGVVTTLPFNREDIRATDLPFNREDIRASELPFTREDIRPTQLPFNREDIRSTELPFSRQNIRGLSQLGQPAISPGLTAAVNTADSIVTTAENTSSDVSQATTAARNIIQGVVDTPQPREAPTELPAVTPSPAMEQPEKPSQILTGSNVQTSTEMPVSGESTAISPSEAPISEQPSPNLAPRANITVARRPARKGRDTSERDAWDEKYGGTHNEDGTPYQPTILDEVFAKVRAALAATSFDENIDSIGVDNGVEARTALEQLLNDGWVWDETANKMVNTANPSETPALGLRRIRSKKKSTPQPQPIETATDAIIQREIPENRVEERLQTDEGGPSAAPSSGNRFIEGGQIQEEVAPPITPQGTPTPATEGTVMPGGSAIERDATKGITFRYEMRARPPSIGTHPENGFVSHEEGGTRHGFLTYDRPLTEQEIYDYELKPVATDSTKPTSVSSAKPTESGGKAESIGSEQNQRDKGLTSSDKPDNSADRPVAPKKGDLVTVSLGGREYPKTRIINVTNTPEGVRYQVDVFGPKFVPESSIVAIEQPVIKTAPKVAATPQLIRQLGDIAVKNKQPLDQGYIDSVGGNIPQGYVKQGDLYVFSPQTTTVAKPTEATKDKANTVKSTELRVGDEVSFKGNTYRVKNILSDGRVRAEFTNPEGIAKLPAGSVNITTLPRNVNFTRIDKQSPQTKAPETETAAPSAKEAAVASVVQQPVEGSIPTVEQESAITAIESNEKADIADAAMAFLEEDLTESKRQWSPEKIAAAKAYFASGGKDMDVLRAAFPKLVGSRPIVQAYLKADKEASEAQAKRDAADAKLAKEIERDEKEQAKAEAAQKKRDELNLKTLNSLIEKTRTNVVQGTVKSSDANQAVAILNKSGAIPNVLFTWIGTSKDFLADPANRARYPETWKAVSSNPNIEGMSENGQPIVFTDNVGVSDLDRNLAKLQGTTPEVAAVRRVILHENIHKGMFFLSLKDKMKLFQFLHRLYSPEELDQLAKSYDEYSDWRINQVSYFSIIEEAMTRDFDSMAEIPRDGIWAEFMQFLRDIWQKITGKTSEPTLKNYKDVFRLIRNSLKNSEKANADRLKNGGAVRMSKGLSALFPRQATIQDAYRAASQGQSSQYILLADVFAKAKEANPSLTEEAFKADVMRLYDSGAIYLEGANSQQEAEAASLSILGTSVGTAVRIAIPQPMASKVFNAGLSSIPYEPQSGTTQVATTVGSYQKAANMLLSYKSPNIRVLDYGAGLGLGSDAMREEIANVDSFEVNPERWKGSQPPTFTDSSQIAEKYDGIVNLNVLNVVPKNIRDAIVDHIGSLLNDGGRAIIGVRKWSGDVDRASGEAGAEPKSIVIKKKQGDTFQKGFDGNELVDYLKERLGDGFLVVKANIAANGAIVTKLPSQAKASKVEYDSPNEATFNSGAEVARNADYDERDKAVRSTIRAAYDLAPKPNGPSVPLDQLFDIAKQSMTDLTEGEFSQILQDLYEDSGALLMEGEVAEYSDPMDYEYMTAVEAGDMATAQELLNKAAAESGLDLSHRSDKPFDEKKKSSFVVMFVDKLKKVTNSERNSGYGKNEILLRSSDLKEPPQWAIEWLTEQPEIQQQADFDNIEPSDLAIESINPPDIIDGAGMWDNPDLVSRFWSENESRIIKEGIYGFKTPDGAIVFDPYSAPFVNADLVIYDDAGNVIPLSQRFNTDGNDIRGNIIVTTPDGQRAGSVIIVSSLPTGAMASTIDPENDATKKFVKDIQGIESGTLKAAFGGRQFFDFEPVEYTVRSNKSYEQTAINYVNNFIAEGGTLEQMANSVIAPNFLAGIGIEDDVMARQALVAEVRNRIVNAGRKKKSKVEKKFFERLNQRISAFWQGVGSKGGRNQGQRAYIIGNPRYSWMFLTDEVDKELKQRRDNILNVQFGNDNATSFTQNSYENADMASTVSADEVAKDTINDTEWDLIKEGEQVFEGARKTIWESVKFLVARIALYARRKSMKAANAKASFTDAQRNELNAILQMSDEEADAAEAKDLAELDSLMAKLLGEESPTDTPTEKKKRNKRKEIIDTVEKRVKAGEPIEAPEEVGTSEDEVTKAEATAQAILKDLSERYSDPLIFRDKKPNINEMRELYKERVKQGNGTSQMTEKTFVNKAIELGADEKTAGILWSAAELEIDAREAMRQDKIRQRNAAAGERADAQAHRIIFAKERLKRQSGFADIDTNPNKDTIIKAFREQVKTPIALDAFIQRLIPLKVSRQVAERLFRAAERENTDLAAMAVYDRTQGPKALKRMISEINLMRRGEEIPLRTPIPWRKLLSQKAKTVEEYRQRIFDAISANEELKSATPEQKARLADLFTEAWESNRKRILDGMQERLIREKEAKGELSKKGAEALQEQRMRMVEDINLGIFDNDEIAKIMAEKFGIKSEFTDAEREKIESLIEVLQDEKLNRVKRNKAAYELLETLSAQTDIPISKLLANFWVSSVLSGMNTVFSIGMSVFSGMGELTTTLYRIFVSAFSNPKQLPSEVAATFKTLARVLSAVPRQANRAWQYLVTGDQAFLDPTMNDALKNMDWDSIGKNTQLAEQMAKSDKTLQKVMGLFMRTVSRLLTALDLFNSGLTKEGSLSLVFRQLNLDPAKIEMLEKKSDLKAYKAQVIEKYFGNMAPKTAREKALVDSYAMAEMMKELDELGSVSENADQMAMQGAMTLDPSGIGGYGYRFVKLMMKSAESGADKLVERNLRKLDEAQGASDKTEAGLKLALSYIFQFAAYNAANLLGVRFARFAGNKFNQSLSFLPIIGALRLYEAEFDADRIRGKEAFTDMIKRNQLTGVMAAAIGYVFLKAIAEEPDDEKRGWFINGGWSNLTPEKKQQKLASGQKEYTLGFGDTVINYGNWPGSGIIAAIGGLSDLIRFSPEQWSEKTVSNKLMSATASGVFSALEVPALSQFQELFGSSLSSKDPNEQKLTKFARVIGNYAGGFVPRILKDIDYLADPNFRKYETLWEKTASHIPIYRRYEGKEYYDILGQQIQRNIYPGSREFMTKPTDPAYKVLGALNSRGIWLTPANAEHRMVGKGARRRSLTQEEADNYSLETGKGYKQMLLRYGQRALQMPTERAKAFLLDKADDVRDRALKKVYRGYTPAS